MGNYTGLYCDVLLKPEFIPVIRKMMSEHTWDGHGYDYMDNYAKDDRSTFIPFGSLAYMPDEFPDFDPPEKVPHDDGRWVFSCSLKNYDDTIETFLYTVLPHIVVYSNVVETLYESARVSTAWWIYEGVAVKLSTPGTLITDEDDDEFDPSRFIYNPPNIIDI